MESLEGRLLPAVQFLTAPNFGVGPQPLAGAAGDFNGDGVMDLITVNADQSTPTAGSVSVLLGNGDGTFKAAINSPAGRCPGAVAVGDLNGDGKLDVVAANILDNTLSLLFGRGDGTFLAPISLTVGSAPVSVVLGDFTGDQKPDIVVSLQTQNLIKLLPGNGDGTFGAALGVPAGGWGLLASGDFNGDGKRDLAYGGNSLVTVLLGKGNGSFGLPIGYATLGSPYEVVAADMNGDGTLDLVTANYSFSGGQPGYVNVLLNDGTGSFGADLVTRVPGEEHDGVAVADFDGDGRPDVATTCFDQGEVAVLRGRGDGTFFDPALYVADQETFDVLAGDFDGDGKADLAAINTREFVSAGGSVSILLNRGDGTFAAAPAFDAGVNPQWVVTADVNGDGIPDLVVANAGSNDVSILLGSGGGRFATAASYPAHRHPVAVAAGDFDGDGKADIAVANRDSNDVNILLGNGDGTFRAAVNVPVGQYPEGLVAGDFNGDGALDLAVTAANDSKVNVLLGRGDGTFAKPAGFAAGIFPVGIATADLDGDGKLDLVVGNSFTNGVVSVLSGRGDGTFGNPVTYATGASYSEEVALGDLNGDGRPDLVVANDGDSVVSVLLNRGDGTFGPPTTYASGVNPFGLALADFNADGKMDVAASNSTNPDHTVSLFLGNGDGTFAPARSFVTASNPFGMVAGDFDGSGSVDLAVAGFDGSITLLGNTLRLPTLSIGDASVSVGSVGNTTAAFSVTLSAPSSQVVTVRFATADGSASAGSDYQSASGTLTLNPGQTSGTINVPVPGQATTGTTATFFVNLAVPVNAGLARSQGVGTIRHDNPRPPTLPSPRLQASSDSGASPGDGITNVTHPFFDVAGVLPGLTLRLLRDGVVVNDLAAPAGGTVTIDDPGPVPDGAHSYTAVQVDRAGTASSEGPALLVTTDTAPPASPGTPALEATSDSGKSQSDRITNITNPTLDVVTTEAGAAVRLFRDGSLVGSRVGPGPIQDSGPIADGVHAYAARVVDVAGNASPLGPSVSVTIDTAAPAAPPAPDLEAASDSGTSPSDNITNVTAPSFDVAGVEPGATVRLLRDNLVVASIDAPLGGTVVLRDPGPVADGVHAYKAQTIDPAGNASPVGPSLNVTILTTGPGIAAPPVLEAASDSGASNSDRVTSVAKPTFDVVPASAGTVQLLRDGAVVGRRIGPGPIAESTALADGVYRYTARQVDVAGNVGPASPAILVTIDTTAPSAPTARLDPSDDSGVSGDGLTINRRPHLTGTAEPGATVQLLDSATGMVLGSALASPSDGSYRVRPILDLPTGWISVGVRAIDAAMNVGLASPSIPLTIVRIAGDFDGDGKADPGTFRPATALWTVQGSTSPISPRAFGATNLDLPLLGDFDGDGKADLAVYRPTTAQWLILQSSAGPRVVTFGAPNLDIPVPADYDGDGKIDLAVYRPTTAQWFILQSSAGARVIAFGAPNLDRPVPADYDGDGKADLAVFRPTTAQWLMIQSASGPRVVAFGAPNLDRPIPADYDGDGKADVAVFRPTTAQWLIARSSAGPKALTFGAFNLDIPVPADYDGDGKADLAVFRPTTAQWLILQSSMGPKVQVVGIANDLPLPAAADLRRSRVGVNSLRARTTSTAPVQSSPSKAASPQQAVPRADGWRASIRVRPRQSIPKWGAGLPSWPRFA